MHSAVPRFVDTATFVLTRSWGTFDGPVEEESVSIRGFAVSGAGVGLLHFDGDGRYVGKIASVGEGPTEVGCEIGRAHV